MQHVPSDLFTIDILCYLSHAELLPISFTCESWSKNVADRINRDHIAARHLIFPCDNADVVNWWRDELRGPCSEELDYITTNWKDVQSTMDVIRDAVI